MLATDASQGVVRRHEPAQQRHACRRACAARSSSGPAPFQQLSAGTRRYCLKAVERVHVVSLITCRRLGTAGRRALLFTMGTDGCCFTGVTIAARGAVARQQSDRRRARRQQKVCLPRRKSHAVPAAVPAADTRLILVSDGKNGSEWHQKRTPFKKPSMHAWARCHPRPSSKRRGMQ